MPTNQNCFMPINKQLEYCEHTLSSIILYQAREEGCNTTLNSEMRASGKEYPSDRYDHKTEKSYREFHTEQTDDLFSKLVRGEEGSIHLNSNSIPQELCECTLGKVDRKRLIVASINFFFPELQNVSNAFSKEFYGSAYCFKATDACPYTVFMAFDFEKFGNHGFTLRLITKRQLKTKKECDAIKQIEKQLLSLPNSAKDRFEIYTRAAREAKKLLDTLFGDNIEHVMTNAIRIQKHMPPDTRRPTPIQNDKFVQIINSGHGTLYIWDKEYGDGVMCEGVQLDCNDQDNIGKLIAASMIHYYHSTDIQMMKERPDKGDIITSNCWQLTDKSGDTWLCFFQVDINDEDNTISLKLIGSRRVNTLVLLGVQNQMTALRKKYNRPRHRMTTNTYAKYALQVLNIILKLQTEGKEDEKIWQYKLVAANYVTDSGDIEDIITTDDEFVTYVNSCYGHIFYGDVHEGIEKALCESCLRSYTDSEKLMRTAIPHFLPQHGFTDIREAFLDTRGEMCLQATDREQRVWLFVFAIHRGFDEVDLHLLNHTKIDGFTLQEIQADAFESYSGISNELEFSNAIDGVLRRKQTENVKLPIILNVQDIIDPETSMKEAIAHFFPGADHIEHAFPKWRHEFDKYCFTAINKIDEYEITYIFVFEATCNADDASRFDISLLAYAPVTETEKQNLWNHVNGLKDGSAPTDYNSYSRKMARYIDECRFIDED